MRAIRGEPVEVWLRHGRPARFVWRSRIYTVLFVLDHRLPPGPPADPASLAGRECWRVEAAPERAMPPATYELCRDLDAARWSLTRV